MASKKTIFLASSNQKDIADITQQFVATLEKSTNPNLDWYYQPMPEETHGSIYHPAAILAFRKVFKPVASNKR
jgi:uncharacterized protein